MLEAGGMLSAKLKKTSRLDPKCQEQIEHGVGAR